MPPVNMLIKPASSKCNMRCKYCFYTAIAMERETADMGIMSDSTLESLIKSGIEYADGIVSFAFQGGEPTLAGLDFYKKAVELQNKYLNESNKRLEVHNALQTNGLVINEEWAKFLHDNNFLVGLSMDGPINVHDKNRVDAAGHGTFERIMRTIELFDKYKVEYNILSVVTGQNAMAVRRIYNFYKKHNFKYLQFIPCLEPIEEERGSESYHLSVQEYGDFLINIFDLWYNDFVNGNYISIRHIDNWIGMILGDRPEACNMNGHCSIQFVIEGDGGIYPCDFYVFDQWKLGTIGETSLEDIVKSDKAQAFLKESFPIPEECKKCRYGALCRNGCKRDRIQNSAEEVMKNYYCKAVYRFFSEREDKLMNAASIVRKARMQGIR